MSAKQGNKSRSTAVDDKAGEKSAQAEGSADQQGQSAATEQPSPGQQSDAQAQEGNQDAGGDADEAQEGNQDAGGDADEAQGEVRLEVATREARRIRAGVTVRRQPREVAVTEDQARRLEADGRITVRRL